MAKKQVAAIWLPTEETWCEWIGWHSADPESEPARGDIRVETHAEAVAAACQILSEVKKKNALRWLILAEPEYVKQRMPQTNQGTQEGRAEIAAGLIRKSEGIKRVLGLKLTAGAVGFAVIDDAGAAEVVLNKIGQRNNVTIYRAV